MERAFVTLRPVAAGEELTLSYLPSAMEAMGTVVRRRHLWLSRGFLCHCDRCSQPQDDVRQVECPACCADAPRERRNSRDEIAGGSGSPEALDKHPGGDHGKDEEIRRPSKEPAVFADWWNQSRMWVCRSCGWCSDGADKPGTLCLQRKEGILGAEVFALVMANAVACSTPAPASRRCRSHVLASGGGSTTASSGGEGAYLQGGEQQQQRQQKRQARRDAVQGLLGASVALLGRRHWATFSCALLRLEQALSAFSEKVSSSSGPWSTSAPSSQPKAKRTEFLDWAMQELNALWQWLSIALETATSHPPAYYLFDVVCDLLLCMGLTGEDSGKAKEILSLAERVEPWVSAFADEEDRRRFAAAVAAARGASSDRDACRPVSPS